MTKEYPHYGLDGKIKCEICQKSCVLQMNDDGTVLFTCEEFGRQWSAPAVCWEDIAAKVSAVTRITDFYLDFLHEIVEKVTIYSSGISIKMQNISEVKRSELLHLQDHWLVYYSLQGDLRAKEQIVSQIGPLIKYHLYGLNRKGSLQKFDFEDLEQTIWLSVFSYLKSYNSKYRLWTWIKCIATRVYYKQIIKERKAFPSENIVRISDQRQRERPSNIDYWESCEYVRNLLQCLTAQESWVVVEYIFKQKPQNRLAREGNLKIRNIRKVYNRALDKLRILVMEENRCAER